MKIVIAGGSGQLGAVLGRALLRDGHDIVILSRRHLSLPFRSVVWDAAGEGPWWAEIDGSDAVINLAGRSVNCRYTATNRAAILESRVASTRAIGEAIGRAGRPPSVWFQASTATIYCHRYDAPNDERTGVIGGNEPDAPASWRFSIEVARAWEAAVNEAQVGKTRKVILRAAVVMSPDRGGIFDIMRRLARRGLGGRAGHGRQYVSWIHHHDFAGALRWLLVRQDIDGIVNFASPNPIPQAEFMRDLRIAAGVPFGLPANRLMLEAGAFLMRTETELLLKSRRVVPGRLLEEGFAFTYPIWRDAVADLCGRSTAR